MYCFFFSVFTNLLNFFNQLSIEKINILCVSGRADPDTDAEAGARLTLHLLLRLFKTIEVPQPSLYSVGMSYQLLSKIIIICQSFHYTNVNLF